MLIWCCYSVAKSHATLCDPMDCSTPDFPVLHISQSLLNSYPLSWGYHPTVSCSVAHFSSYPQPFQHLSLFQKVGSLHQVAKELDSSCSVSPSNECAELISLGIDWFDFLKDWLIWFLAVQGTLKCLLQHHSSKASILQHLTFIMIQLSYPYMTTGKTLALIRWTFVGKVMSLLFHTPSRFVIAFLPRSKRLLISWLQSPSIGILEPNKIKSVTVSIVPPSICHEVMGLDAMIFGFGMLSFKPTFSLSPFPLIKRLFSSSLLSAIQVVSSAYLRLLIFLPEILTPACASSSPAFHMMNST